jgi:inosose dehydratase
LAARLDETESSMPLAIKLGSAPINWGIEDAGPTNPLPSEVLNAVQEDGYQGLELGALGYFGLTSAAILAQFRARKLAVVTTWYDVDLTRPLDKVTSEELTLICGFLKDGNANVLLISDKMDPRRLEVVARVHEFPDVQWNDAQWARVPRTLTEISDLAAQYGLTVAVHPHVGTHIETGDEIARVAEIIADLPIKFCFDSGHILIGGSDPIAFLDRQGPNIIHVHAKDVDGKLLEEVKAGRQTYFEAIGNGLYCDLGTGLVDWQGFANGLRAVNYSGWVVAEQDQLLKPGSRQPFISDARNRVFLTNLLLT